MSKITLSYLIDFYLRIDLRSLALFRIFAALLLMHDWFVRLPDLEAFYTSFGLLPIDSTLPKAGGIYHFSLLDGCRTLPEVQLAFACGLLFYLMLLVGYQTKIAKFASFIFFASVLSRSLVLHASSHLVLIVMLMWSLFLPLGERFSLDHWLFLRKGKKEAVDTLAADLGSAEEISPAVVQSENGFSPWNSSPSSASASSASSSALGSLQSSLSRPSLAALAIIGQIAAIYFFTAFVKYGTPWLDFTALYYALQIDQVITPLGRWLSNSPLWLIKLMTASTLALEWCSAILILSPLMQPLLRRVAIGALTLLHLGIWLTIDVGDFSPIMVATYALLLLPQDWLWLANLHPIFGEAKQEPYQALKRGKALMVLPMVLSNLAVAVIASALLLDAYNINAATRMHQAKLIAPPLFQAISKGMFLKQDWHLFAPDVLRDDGWMVIDGLRASGEHWDPLAGKEPTYDKPEHLQSRLPSILWRKYFYRLQKPFFAPYRSYYCKYLLRKSQRDDKPADQLLAMHLIYCREITQAPGVEQPFAVVPVLLWQEVLTQYPAAGKALLDSVLDLKPRVLLPPLHKTVDNSEEQVNSD